ncbi:unnamed protein product [Rhodiola kirilowii]
MSGSLRFESTSASSEELGYTSNNYSNGHRGNYLGSSLGRSGSFRESNDNRVSGFGPVPRGPVSTVDEDVPPLSQCLALEPITIGDKKFNRSGEVKRVLGFSYSNVTEDSPPPVAQEDLKRFKASVADTSLKARGRTKKLDESLHKLNKYYDAIHSQKYQRNELMTNEKSVVPTLPKNGVQMQRNLSEERSKNGNLNKRVRTAVAELRSEGRNNAPSRQNILLAKDKETSTGSDIPEEKIRKRPAGGEGWDQKMKKKRSMGTVFMRSSEDETDLKRPMSQKINSGSNLQLSDAQSGRSASLSGTNSMRDSPFSVSVNAHGMAKSEPEKVSLLRDANPGTCTDRAVTKGNYNKVNVREDNRGMSSNPVMKGKGSRTLRNGPVTVASSSPNLSRLSGGTEGWDQPSSVNKFQSLNGNNNHKRPILSGSSSPPMAQWVGQRPQKIQRNRRANLISPVSNHEDMQTSSEGCSPETGGMINSSATNVSPRMKGVSNGLKQMKVKHEIVSSPGLFSESEESGAGDSKIEEKGKTDANSDGSLFNGGRHTGSSSPPMKKNKLHLKDDNGDGVRRQGRSGRGSQTVTSSASPVNERLESAAKPVRIARPGYDKSGSKSGRPPLKKSSDRSKFTRLGQIPNGGSPDYAGDSEDDREELLAVAEFVRDSSSVTCANSFWKQMERVFGSVRSGEEGAHYLEQELKSSEQLHDNLLMLKCEDNTLGNDLHDKISVPPIPVSEDKERNVSNDVTRMSARTADVVDKFQDNISMGKFKDFPPLYQRVLSALIVEDEFEEINEAYGESEGHPHLSKAHFPSSIDHREDNMDFEYDAILGLQMRKQSAPNNAACNGNYVYDHGEVVHRSLCNSKVFQNDAGAKYKANGDNFEHIPCIPPFDCPYDQMHLEDRLLLELHSIGLYPDTVPDLSDADEVISEEIFAMKSDLYELVDKKRMHLRKACEAVQEEEREGRYLEKLAIDRLTEVAYRKLLATRGSSSSKSGPAKISRQIALPFVKRTLARCHNFEAFGKSCFGDPSIRDILAAHPCVTFPDASHSARIGCVHNRGSTETVPGQAFGGNGPMLDRGKRKEVLLDDVGATSLRAYAALGSQLSGGGAKGKRSDRDAGNNSVKNGRPSLGSSKGERQPKSKPKPKSSQHPTSGFPGTAVHNTGNGPTEAASNRKKNTGPSYSGSVEPKKNMNGQMDFSNLPLHDLDLIEDLGVGTALGEHQDLDAWLNFDDDGLPEHDALDPLDLSGLEIPMDDLNMIL